MDRSGNLIGRLSVCLAALLACTAHAADLRVLVDTGTEMPLAAFH